ncbi:fatty-acid amide hydrolase 1-like [Liolophura sinensis]|uniref:fatty-acid amide hydrolase 1-like n=1 Tax=Liolophura sinensis TaxID=3198878 RepID=UPI0031583B4E
MHPYLMRISENCPMMNDRKTRVLVGGGGVILVLLLKKLYRVYTVRNLKKKVEERRKERQEDFDALAEKLQEDGLTIDARNAIISLTLKELQEKLRSGDLTAQVCAQSISVQGIASPAVHKLCHRVDQRVRVCLLRNGEDVLTKQVLINLLQDLAKACDNSVSKGGMLHGVPVSIKENYCLKGYDCTAGIAGLLGNTFQEDAVIVQVLKAQGAVPFIRTNIPQTLLSAECSNPIYGVTVNPHDVSRCPGGSSGGEGALVGSEGSILGFGTDIGGSLRIPAHMCGIYSLKPTRDRLSSKGIFGLLKGQNLIQACPGPMAHDVNSLAVAMEALLSPLMYELDPVLPRMPFNSKVYRSTNPLRIGYFLDTGVVQPIPAVQRAVHLAKEVLQQQGHTFVQIEPPCVEDALFRLYSSALFGDGGHSFMRYLDKDLSDVSSQKLWAILWLPRRLKWILSTLVGLVSPKHGRMLLSSKGVDSVAEWWQLTLDIQKYREMFIEQWQKLKLDVVVSPGYASTATPSGFASEAEGSTSYTTIYNVLNFPAGSMPVTKVSTQDEEDLQQHYHPKNHHERVLQKSVQSRSPELLSMTAMHVAQFLWVVKGMPVNVQCVALPFQEELVLRIMRDLERV